MFTKLTAVIALVAVVALGAVTSTATAQDDPTMTLAEALAGASEDGWTIVDAKAEGVVPYQFGDDPTNPAQLDVPYGDVHQATAGLFLFGDGVTVDCTDPAQLCSPGFEAPDQGSIYMGFSMTMAGDIPVDGGGDNIINYSFPWIVDGQEPFIELDAFPGDTWQDMSQVVVAESRSPFTLVHQSWVPTTGFPVQPTLTFGLVNGDQIWVFVPVEQDPFGLRAGIIARTIEQVLNNSERSGSVSLTQALADAIATTKWGAAVHIHKGDFGRTNPSTITALPATPRPPGSGYPPPTMLTLLGVGEPVAIPPKTLDPETAVVPPVDETPVTEAPTAPAVDNPAESSSGFSVLVVLIVIALLVLLVVLILFLLSWFRSQKAPDVEGEKPASDNFEQFVVPDGAEVPPTQTSSHTREDGTKVDWWGVPNQAEETTYTYTDGTVRVERSSRVSNDIRITRPDGTVESWQAQEVYDQDHRERIVESHYNRFDVDGNVLESSDWDGQPPYPA